MENTQCTSCKMIYYCDKQHQTQDWKNHKSLCRKLTKEASLAEIETESTEKVTVEKAEDHTCKISHLKNQLEDKYLKMNEAQRDTMKDYIQEMNKADGKLMEKEYEEKYGTMNDAQKDMFRIYVKELKVKKLKENRGKM